MTTNIKIGFGTKIAAPVPKNPNPVNRQQSVSSVKEPPKKSGSDHMSDHN